eukprot:TRINITY_DN25952_c0_g1_i1.p1 TRINITY_DN25952_c0_g1~~TRINITY_DN25952_c0_g1_i1.p1  ORF type:complete len:517 (-),score=79.34 TRINITY_DN25952_c0_g1_i1:121-1671(-)
MSGDTPDPQSHRSADGFDYILDCARRNDASGVRKIVARGCPPTFANPVGQSALHIGALWGSVDAVKALLELKANPCAQNDKRRATPLHVAATGRGPPGKRADCVKVLLEYKGNPEMTDHAGDKAIDLADDDEVRIALGEIPLLLHQVVGAKNASRVEQVIERIQTGRLPQLPLDKKDAQGLTALHYSVHMSWYKGVEMLGAAGAAACTQAHDGETPLHLAVQNGVIDIVQKLIELRANPNVRDQDRDADPRYTSKSFAHNPAEHRTPLHYAAERCNVAAIQMLLEARADPNVNDSKVHSPLYLALASRQVEGFDVGSGVLVVGTKVTELNDCLAAVTGEVIVGDGDAPPRWPIQVSGKPGKNYLLKKENLEALTDKSLKILLEARADVNSGMGEARTALHEVSRGGDAELVALLLKARASLDQQDKKGFSALHIAARSKHGEVVDLLVNARASLELRTSTGMTAAELAKKNGCGPSILSLLGVRQEGTDVTDRGGYAKDPTVKELTAEQRAALFID